MPLRIGAAYIRVSTEEQTEYSPDSQLKLIREYAKREDYLIPDEFVYQDDGISGRSAERRPGFRLMIATAKEKESPFDSIFVWKYSRFARNQEEAIMYKNLLKRKGVTVRSVSEPSSEDNPFASLIERIIEWMDEYYLINLSEEVKRGLREKVSRGETIGYVPFGYRLEGKLLVPDENADWVRYVFREYASGKGSRVLANELTAAGIRTNHKGTVSTNNVLYMLHNPVYIGKIRYCFESKVDYIGWLESDGTATCADGKHEAIIDMETWSAVQARFHGRRAEVKYVRQDKEAFMLQGLVRCDSCGAMITRQHNMRGRWTMQCNAYARSLCHVSHSIVMEKAERAVIDSLADLLERQDFIFVPKPRMERSPHCDWDKLIAQENTRLARARDALLDGTFTHEEYRQLRPEIEERIRKLERSRDEEAAPSNPNPADYVPRVAAVLETLQDPGSTGQAKNEALRSIIDHIVFKKPGNTFDFFFLP